jgi:small subunit ribosomal protein S21
MTARDQRDSRPPQKPRNEGPTGTRVEVRDNNMGQAMRRLKKILQSEGVLKEMRERTFFEKPSMKRKAAKAAARKRLAKEIAKRDEL